MSFILNFAQESILIRYESLIFKYNSNFYSTVCEMVSGCQWMIYIEDICTLVYAGDENAWTYMETVVMQVWFTYPPLQAKAGYIIMATCVCLY